jgi:pimeloyl-ACP methyl ester carboxylesterase
MPDEGLKLYQHSYFSAHKLVNSHNLIVASPKSVVAQWTNGDNGQDLPHLYEVIDWVYEKFSSKFKITGMWVGGHSWGSMFAKRFVCDPLLAERVRGVIGMSGGPIGIIGGCASKLSEIHTVGEQEGGEAGVPDQTGAAAAHGCEARLAPRDIGNGQMLYDWPNCDPGWTHHNFVMGNHNHITPIDDPVVKYIVDQIKATEGI